MRAEGTEIIGHTGCVERAELNSLARLTRIFCFCRYCRWHCVSSTFCCVEQEDVRVPLSYHSAHRLADRNNLDNATVRQKTGMVHGFLQRENLGDRFFTPKIKETPVF